MTSYEEIFESALAAMETQDYAQSFTLWTQAAQLLNQQELCDETASELAIVWLNQAVCSLQLERFEDVVEFCRDALMECQVPSTSELGQQLLGTMTEALMHQHDLASAREVAEQAAAALEESADEVELGTIVALAIRRGALARLMETPDDAEETFGTAEQTLKSVMDGLEPESEALPELQILLSRLLEARAQNRYQGRAQELAVIDMEDSVTNLEQALGAEHPDTQEAQKLLQQLRGF